MNGAQQAAARRRREQQESEDHAREMSEFVTNGPGALLVADDEPAAVTPAPGFDDEEPAAFEGTIEPKTGTAIVKFTVTPADIATTKAKYAGLSTDTKEGAEAVRQARRHCVETRVAVDDRRKQLNADSLAWQRSINAEAKQLIALIKEVEDPLDAKIKAYDAERQREKDEALRKKNEEIAAKLRAEREAEDAERKAKHDAEQAELAAQRAQLERDKEAARVEREAAEARQREEQAVRDSLAECERQEREAEQARRDAEVEAKRLELETEAARLSEIEAGLEKARQAARAREAEEREAFEAEKRAFQAQKDAAAKAESDRLAKLEADRVAAENAEADRVAAAEKAESDRLAAVARAEAERIAAEAEAVRIEAIRPDIERVRGFAKKLRAIKEPDVKSLEAAVALSEAMTTLGLVATALEQFGAESQAQATAAE